MGLGLADEIVEVDEDEIGVARREPFECGLEQVGRAGTDRASERRLDQPPVTLHAAGVVIGHRGGEGGHVVGPDAGDGSGGDRVEVGRVSSSR